MKTSIELTFTNITFYRTESQDIGSIRNQGKLTIKQAKELIPEKTVFVTKEIEKDSFEVYTEELLKLKIEKGDKINEY